MNSKIKFLAYYLPQYHQIPENDEWWGEGFTEWTNVKKAKPLFKGHQQPIVPGELGYYDLLKSEGIQEKQAALAKEYGIDGFIYYQYWFGGGKMLLEKPAEKMLANKDVDIPFCFCWANETWSGIWHGAADKVLIEQKYLGKEDYINYFNYLLPFFQDERYIRIEGKPLLFIYDINRRDHIKELISVFQNLARENGFSGLHISASNRGLDNLDYKGLGLDATVSGAYNGELDVTMDAERKRRNGLSRKILKKILKTADKPVCIDYTSLFSRVTYGNANVETYPVVVPNWDNTARSSSRGLVLNGSSPQLFAKELQKAVDFLEESKQKNKILVIKSWNEWAEGNYMEPDKKNGKAFLEAVNFFKLSDEKDA